MKVSRSTTCESKQVTFWKSASKHVLITQHEGTKAQTQRQAKAQTEGQSTTAETQRWSTKADAQRLAHWQYVAFCQLANL